MKITAQQFGFTLIEILVVVSIIGILAALLLANMVGVRERAADARAKSNLNQLKNALRMYYNDNQQYPSGSDVDCSSLSSVVTNTYIDADVIPQSSNGYSCKYTGSGDVFTAYIVLQSQAGSDDTDSAARCPGASAVEGRYYICAN